MCSRGSSLARRSRITGQYLLWRLDAPNHGSDSARHPPGGRACQPPGCRRRLSAGKILGTDERHCGKRNCKKPESCARIWSFRDIVDTVTHKSVPLLAWSERDACDLKSWIAHNASEDNSGHSRTFECIQRDTRVAGNNTLDPIRVTLRAYARVHGYEEGQIQSFINCALVRVQTDPKHGSAKVESVPTVEITKGADFKGSAVGVGGYSAK